MDTLVWAKFCQQTDEKVGKSTFKCNGKRSCQFFAFIVVGEVHVKTSETSFPQWSFKRCHCKDCFPEGKKMNY